MASNTNTQSLQATCLCGSANHEIPLKPNDIPLPGHMCHCNSCRHIYGSMCSTLVRSPAHYNPSSSLLSKLTKYAFSSSVSMHFCPTCGCHMFCEWIKDPINSSDITWLFASGTLSRIEDVVDWKMHKHVQDTLDGGFADFVPSINGKPLPRYSSNENEGEELPLPWTSPDLKPSNNDKLHASCHCTGVSFYISRASPRSALAKHYYPNTPPFNPPPSSPEQEETYHLRASSTKFLTGLCACNSCRLASGVETTTWAFVPTYQITQNQKPWTPSFGTLKQYQSSPGCYRYFCSTCGAIIFYDAEDRLWFKDIAMGLFHPPEGARVESWFGWRTSRLGYRDDAIPRAEGYSLAIEKGLREWEERREGEDLSGGSQSAGAL